MSKQSSRGPRWERLRREVLDRDGWVCTSCGNALEEGSDDPHHIPTADHVIPKAAGGRDELSNLAAMCLSCNSIKQANVQVRVDWFNPRWFPNGLPT